MTARLPCARDSPSDPTPSAARRRLREASGFSVQWRFYAAQLFERAIYVAVIGGFAVQCVRSAVANAGPGRADLGGASGTTLVLSVLAFSVLLKGLLAVGPVNLSSATSTWLAASPLDRRELLLRSYLQTLIVVAAVGLFWPAVLFLLTGFGVSVSVFAVLVSGTAAVGSLGFAVAIQASRPVVADMSQRGLSILAGVSVLLLLVDLVADRRILSAVQISSALWPAAPAVAVVVSVVAAMLIVTGLIALGRLTRSALSSGRTAGAGLALSVTSFEFGLLGSLMTERRAIQIGHVRSRRVGRRNWLLVLVLTDLVRLGRAPGKLLTVGGLILVPALFAAGTTGAAAQFVPVVFTLVAFLVADRLAGTQRIVIRSAGVRRLLNLSRCRLELGLAAVPLTGTVIWCLLAQSLTAGISLLQVAVAAAGAVVAVYRIATRPPLTFDGAAFDIGILGPTPLDLLKQLSRGPALLLGVALLQTLLP